MKSGLQQFYSKNYIKRTPANLKFLRLNPYYCHFDRTDDVPENITEDLSEPIVEAADSIDQEDAQVKSLVVEQTLALAIGKKFVWIVVSFVNKFVEGEFRFGIEVDQGKLGSFMISVVSGSALDGHNI